VVHEQEANFVGEHDPRRPRSSCVVAVALFGEDDAVPLERTHDLARHKRDGPELRRGLTQFDLADVLARAWPTAHLPRRAVPGDKRSRLVHDVTFKRCSEIGIVVPLAR
jgi:hypothetical protein